MKGFIWLVIGVLALFGISFVIEPHQERECKSKSAAYTAVKRSIEYRLKAPSTADWPGRGDSQVLVASTNPEECAYEVWGYVDAQNGFGAMIRTDYYAKTRYSKEESRWITSNINM